MATSKPRVYIDSCYYIDVARGRHAAPLDAGRELHIPKAGDIEVWASTLIISECLSLQQQAPTVPEEVQATFVSLLTSGSIVKLAAVDFFIAEKARDLLWVDGIHCGGGADMIHVATAIELGCEEFITANRRRGPLQGDAPAKLASLHKLRIIEAPQTSVLPPHYHAPLLDKHGA